jgi:Fe-S cluster assembly protein SufD
MESSIDTKKRFNDLFAEFASRLNGHKNRTLHSYREMAMKKVNVLEFPTTREENWKYTSLRRILQLPFTLATEPISGPDLTPAAIPDAIPINVINGRVSGELPADLPEGLTIMSLESALETPEFSTFIRRKLEENILASDEIFSLLSTSLGNQGLFIHVSANKTISKPVCIHHRKIQDNAPVFNAAIMIVHMETGSELEILEHFTGEAHTQESCLLINNLHTLGANARLNHYKLQSLGTNDYLIYTNEAIQARDSQYTHFNAEVGARLVRNNIRAVQSDPNVTTNLYGVFPGNGEQHADTQTSIDHASPHGISHEWYRSLLSANARGVFNGKVIVRPDAQKINAYQQNDTLLLSEKARMDTKPQLEIFADDVRCSHGATIGQLDEQQLFYLQSRGLNEAEAQNILLWGFIGKISEFIANEDIRSLIEKALTDKLHSMN